MRVRPALHALWITALSLLACASLGSVPAETREGTVTITVNPDGSFTPAEVEVRAGSTVVWALSDRYRDSIVPLKPGADACASVAPYAGGPEDFTGPMPRNPSGVFVLNQDGPGLSAVGDPPRLEETGPLGAVMDESWKSPGNVGAFLRLRWNWLQPKGPGSYDWTVLDREVAKAVASGKLYSIGIKAGHHGTPSWIFDAGVEKLTFREFGTHAGVDDCKCGAFMELGDPTDARYQELYFGMLEAVAEHLRSNAAWYRNLAYVKPSGANLYSAENRLPKRCSCAEQCPGETCRVPREHAGAPNLGPDGRICNTKVWAEAGFTPDGLYRFYDRQLDLLARRFPEKDMAFLLIHDGFPRVASRTEYLECGEGKAAKGVPPPVSLTREILQRGWKAHRERFTLQHAGLRPDHKINNMLTKERQPSQVVGLQTTNDVTDAAMLDRTMRNALDNSVAAFVEVYEGGALDAARKPGSTDWNAALHARRRKGATERGPLSDPFPTQHEHTFGSVGTYRYVNPYRCKSSASVGSIRVVP
jgi:hypothetical protein